MTMLATSKEVTAADPWLGFEINWFDKTFEVSVLGTFVGTIKLQALGADDTTWIDVWSTTTATATPERLLNARRGQHYRIGFAAHTSGSAVLDVRA